MLILKQSDETGGGERILSRRICSTRGSISHCPARFFSVSSPGRFVTYIQFRIPEWDQRLMATPSPLPPRIFYYISMTRGVLGVFLEAWHRFSLFFYHILIHCIAQSICVTRSNKSKRPPHIKFPPTITHNNTSYNTPSPYHNTPSSPGNRLKQSTITPRKHLKITPPKPPKTA